jgi:hypothetical protein
MMREEGRQAGVVVAGGVGVVGEELLGCVKLGVGSRGSRNGRRSPVPGRCLGWQGTQRMLRLLAARHEVRARLGEELRCTGAEEPAVELVVDMSRATVRDKDGGRAVEKQSRGSVGFTEEA